DQAGGGHAGGAGRDLTATVVGGGLAGSEAAWALAARGVSVTLYEMRPVRMTAAHQTDRLAELVCSNSFKSVELGNAHGLLKAELRRLGSVVLEAADAARVPGGAALAVDRTAFAQRVHDRGTGEQYQPHREFDRTPYFEGCLPVEEMAARGRDVLRFGPMKPVGLPGEAFAVVQLRQEDQAGQMWNLVGFQTRLKIPDQQRV